MKRFAALGLVVLHATAWAQSLEQKPPTARASVTVGGALRTSYLSNNQLPLTISLGVAPLVVHGAGAYFFLPWLGAAIDASVDTFTIEGNDLVMTDPNNKAKQRLVGYRLIGEGVGRWSPTPAIGLELHLGYGGGQWASIRLDEQGRVQPGPVDWQGGSLGFAIAFEPDGAIGGMFFGRSNLSFGALSDYHPWSLSSGFDLHLGNLAVGELRGALQLELEVIGAGGKAGAEVFSQTQLRGSLGVRIRHQPPAPVDPNAAAGVVKTGNGSVRGRVVFGTTGLSGVAVTMGTLPLTKTAPDGAFDFPSVKPGPYLIRAVAEGYKPAEQTVDVPPGGEALVTLGLSKPTGPGQLRGVVKGEKDQVVEGAEVALEGKSAVKTGSDGSYLLEQAGPGPVKVTVKAKGFKDAEDLAQVPPEGSATLDFTLLKQGEKQLATIRGSVKSASGKGVRGTVKIAEANMTIPVKGDGRFVVQVPGGKYTLAIEAAGYVTQVKTVEVADGDQAIFHCDLQPAGR